MEGAFVVLATLALLATTALVLAWRARLAQSRIARVGIDGYQEATIYIQRRYQPHTVAVMEGMPVRLRFRRMEDEPCSDRVVFSGIGVERRLLPFQETLVEFLPAAPGEYLFTCQWGLYRGKLVVRQAPRRQPERHAVGDETD